MADVLLTESGNKIVSETIPGVTGASSLNDTLVQEIFKETFPTDPSSRGWTIGSKWSWDAANLRMKYTP